jgi:hypothetical protein
MNKETQTLEQQAYTYKAVMDVLLEKLDSLTIGWNTWHITDAAGWKTERIPSLFDVNYHPKPAYYALQQSLESGEYHTTASDVGFKNNREEMHIFPNPASDWLNIQSESDFSTVEIINISGITVDHFSLEESSDRIDISKLRDGYYWIKFSNPHKGSHNIQPFIVL